MYHLNVRFFVVFCALGLIGSDAFSAPSVRVLGANTNTNTGTKMTSAKTGDNIARAAVANVAKKSSAKATTMPVSSKKTLNIAGAEKIGATSTSSTVGRLPVISTKTNVQTGYKPGTSTVSPNTSAVKLNEMSDKIDSLQIPV